MSKIKNINYKLGKCNLQTKTVLFPDFEKLLKQVARTQAYASIDFNSKIPQIEHCLC